MGVAAFFAPQFAYGEHTVFTGVPGGMAAKDGVSDSDHAFLALGGVQPGFAAFAPAFSLVGRNGHRGLSEALLPSKAHNTAVRRFHHLPLVRILRIGLGGHAVPGVTIVNTVNGDGAFAVHIQGHNDSTVCGGNARTGCYAQKGAVRFMKYHIGNVHRVAPGFAPVAAAQHKYIATLGCL